MPLDNLKLVSYVLTFSENEEVPSFKPVYDGSRAWDEISTSLDYTVVGYVGKYPAYANTSLGAWRVDNSPVS